MLEMANIKSYSCLPISKDRKYSCWKKSTLSRKNGATPLDKVNVELLSHVYTVLLKNGIHGRSLAVSETNMLREQWWDHIKKRRLRSHRFLVLLILVTKSSSEEAFKDDFIPATIWLKLNVNHPHPPAKKTNQLPWLSQVTSDLWAKTWCYHF